MPPAIPLDPQGRLDADIACVHCGYNLRAADPAANCPECGTPLDRSLRPDILLLADPTWLKRVLSGLGWVRWGVFGIVSLSTFNLIWLLLRRATYDRDFTLDVWVNALLTMTNLILLVGWFRATTNSPLKSSRPPDPPSRWATRIAAAVGSAWMLALMACAAIDVIHLRAFDDARHYFSQVGNAITLAFGLEYLHSLSSRSADYVLARRLGWMARLVLLCLVLIAMGMIIVHEVDRHRPWGSLDRHLRLAGAITILLTWPVLLIVCALSLFQIDRLRRDIAAILRKNVAPTSNS
ncbi:MAG: hypothetical protein IT442_17250 [Phycisphaeraceae bacterium]|nr:hypothetical protein [Phycisphaeraceae bacterium]